MQINGWQYYNHAAIPTTAPPEIPDISPIADDSIRKNGEFCYWQDGRRSLIVATKQIGGM